MLRDEVKLNVPYKSQLDNADNPFGSSNCTSLAMAIAYFDVKPHNGHKQLEDELQEWLETQGLKRYNPYDLVKVVKAYGCQDNFKTDATIDQIKEWLDRGNPAVVHGYFTPAGHVICLIGYNAIGFIVNDPCGQYSESGYDSSTSGEGLTYSYETIERICLQDGEFWVHFISK